MNNIDNCLTDAPLHGISAETAVCQRHSSASMKSIKQKTGHDGVDIALNLIRKCADSPITVAHLIKSSGMSRRGLHKAFMTNTGKGPGSVLREVRMELAQYLLRRFQISIEEVSIRCGYQRTNSFYVAFRRHTGVSPGAFREAAFCMGGLSDGKPRELHP